MKKMDVKGIVEEIKSRYRTFKKKMHRIKKIGDKESIFEAIVRMVKETRAPIRDALLKKVGVNVPDIRVEIDGPTIFEKVGKTVVSVMEKEGWQRVLKPRTLRFLNASPASPVITAVHLFAKCPENLQGLPLTFVKHDGNFVQTWVFSRDFLQSIPKEVEHYTLPVLSRGDVLSVSFSDSAMIQPANSWLDDILKRLNEAWERHPDVFIIRKVLEQAGKEIPENLQDPVNKLLNEVDKGFNIMKTYHLYIECGLAVILDNEVMLPYKWDSGKGKFVPGFFSGGISA